MKTKHSLILAAMLGLLSTIRANPVGLVDEYKFNGNLNDSSGHGLNLTAGGTFRYVTGHDGRHDGAVQLITANPANGTFFLGTGPDLANQSSSVSFWIRDDVPGSESWVFGLGHPSGTGGTLGGDMHVSLGSDHLLYSFFYNDLSAPFTMQRGQWYDITATFDYVTGVRDVYVDGTLFSTDITGTPFTGGDSLKVGFQGSSLDDLRFYNTALTGDQVADLARVPDGGATALSLGLSCLMLVFVRRRVVA